jgi:hypothetical protein
MTNKKENNEMIHCNVCLQKTKHRIIVERIQNGSDDEYDVSWQNTYTLFECCGCENISLRRKSWFSESQDIKVEFYPPPISRRIPKWSHALPTEISALLKEVYTALYTNSLRLAIMGARALVDMFMNDKVGDIGGFQRKSTELVKQGILSNSHKKFLDAALETGHAVIHRGLKPKKHTVEQVIDIVENLLHTYDLEEVSKDLEEDTPQRKKKS